MPQKFEREIDDILRRFDDPPARRWGRRVRRRLRTWGSVLRAVPLELSPSHLFIASVALALLGYVLRLIIPSLAGPVGLLGLVAFVLALILSLTRNQRQPIRQWRGRALGRPTGRGVLDGLWRRLGRWGRGRRFRD